jgi:hypothetical protein
VRRKAVTSVGHKEIAAPGWEGADPQDDRVDAGRRNQWPERTHLSLRHRRPFLASRLAQTIDYRTFRTAAFERRAPAESSSQMRTLNTLMQSTEAVLVAICGEATRLGVSADRSGASARAVVREGTIGLRRVRRRRGQCFG